MKFTTSVPLVTIAILFAIVAWRYYHWHSTRVSACDGCDAHITFTISHQIDQNRSKYIYRYQDLRLECPKNVPKCQLLEDIALGTRLEVTGRVEPWLITSNKNKKRLVIRHIKPISVSKYPELIDPWRLLQKLSDLRVHLESIFQSTLGEPHASLLAGIVLGGRAELSDSFYQALVNTGTLHIIAASGFNISVIAGVLIGSLTRVFPRRIALILSSLGVGAYVILSGASPAVVRAGIMGLALFLAQGAGRDYQAKWLLVMTAWLMLVISPWLIYDASFQLSVAATAGILWGYEPIERLLYGVIARRRSDDSTRQSHGLSTPSFSRRHSPLGESPASGIQVSSAHNFDALIPRSGEPAAPRSARVSGSHPQNHVMLRAKPEASHNLEYAAANAINNKSKAIKIETRKSKAINNSPPNRAPYIPNNPFIRTLVGDAATTIAATLATLPIIAITFGRISLISPITNTLLLWLIPPLMALGGLILTTSLISSILAQVIAWLAWPLLTIFITGIEWFARLPFASFELAEALPWSLGFGFWCLLAALCLDRD